MHPRSSRPPSTHGTSVDGMDAESISSRLQHKRERSDYDEDDELDRPHGWRCLSPEHSPDQSMQGDGSSDTGDLITKTTHDHQKLVKRLLPRYNEHNRNDDEFMFFGGLSMMSTAPDHDFSISGAIPLRCFISVVEDTQVELEIDYPISMLVEGLVDDPNGLIGINYQSIDEPGRRQRICPSLPMFLSNKQSCIEREADSLTKEQLIEHADEVDQACLAELLKWITLGALKMRDRLGSPNIMDSRWVIRFKRMPTGDLTIKAR